MLITTKCGESIEIICLIENQILISYLIPGTSSTQLTMENTVCSLNLTSIILILFGSFGSSEKCVQDLEENESILHHKLSIESFRTVSGTFPQCLFQCRDDNQCQSLNYDIENQECHLLKDNRHSLNFDLVQEPSFIHSDNFWHPCIRSRVSCPIRSCTSQGNVNAHIFASKKERSYGS